ncbi:MAG TPA: hypothetical protein VF181_02575 [Balneolaceae bacterium]
MKFSNLFSYSTLLFLTLSTALMLTGCGNPAGSDEEEHPRPVGIVLQMNGAEIVRYENQEVTGQIEVNTGEETALITLYFLDENGDQFQYDEPEYSLRPHGIDESIAEIEQHAEDGKWSFHVRGITPGTTSVVFELFHGDHGDFETPEIPVIVN